MLQKAGAVVPNADGLLKPAPNDEACPNPGFAMEGVEFANVDAGAEDCPNTVLLPGAEGRPNVEPPPATDGCPKADVWPNDDGCPNAPGGPMFEGLPKDEPRLLCDGCPNDGGCPKEEVCPKPGVCDIEPNTPLEEAGGLNGLVSLANTFCCCDRFRLLSSMTSYRFGCSCWPCATYFMAPSRSPNTAWRCFMASAAA